MKRAFRLGLMLLGVVALAVVAVLLRNRPPAKYQGPVADLRQQLSDFDVETIVMVRLSRAGSVLTLTRGQSGWRSEPYAVRLDPEKLAGLLDSTAHLFAQRIVDESPSELSQYGLESPAVTVEARRTDGSSVKFELGNRTPGGDAYYLRSRDSKAVFTVYSGHGKNFSSTLEDLRDLHLPPLDRDKAATLLLRGSKGRIEVLVNAGQARYAHLVGGYVLRGPYAEELPADGERFQELFGKIADLEAAGFVGDDPALYAKLGLAEPRAELIARDVHNERHLLLGNQAEGGRVYAREADYATVFLLPELALEYAETPSFALVAKALCAPPLERVVEMKIESGGADAHLLDISRRRDQTRTVTSSYNIDGRSATTEAAEAFYAALQGVMVEGAAPTAWRPASGAQPDLTLTYRLEGSAITELDIELLPYNGDFDALRRQGAVEFLVSRGQITTVRTALDRLLARH